MYGRQLLPGRKHVLLLPQHCPGVGSGWGVCLGQKGMLVVFDSSTEASSVLSSIRQHASGASSADVFWVGLRKEGPDSYVCSDGSSMNYNKWKQEITDDVNLGQGCLAITVTGSGVSADVKNCTKQLQFVCEVSTADAVWTGWSTWGKCSSLCGPGTRTRQRTCLRANDQIDCKGGTTEAEGCQDTYCPLQPGELRSTGSTFDYYKAKSECEAQGAHLPVLKSQSDHDALVTFGTDKISKHSELWLGLYYAGTGEVFEWVDGTRTSSMTFTKWARGQPNKMDTEKAVILDVKVDGWVTRKETDECFVICQGRSSATTTTQPTTTRTTSATTAVTTTRTTPLTTAGTTTTPATTTSTTTTTKPTTTSTVTSTTTTTTKPTTTTRTTTSTAKATTVTTPTPTTTSTTTAGTKQKQPAADWSKWGTWSDCSATCGVGERSRHRTCTTGSDSDCSGESNEKESCDAGKCLAASWESWSQWSDCSVTCGQGEQTRQRTCSTGFESDCPGVKAEKQDCGAKPCPDIAWGAWGEWSACSETCEGGQRSRSRRCLDSVTGLESQEKCGGKDSEIELCNKDKCGKASWEGWGQWSACTSSCGKGTRSRSRTCTVDGAPSSDCKGDVIDDATCVMVHCRGLSKMEIVEKIQKDAGEDERLEKLHKWAKDTQHMNENMFNGQNLRDWAITGHVIRSFPVPSRMRCVLKCMGTDGCRSLNFRYQANALGQFGCELNSVGRDDGLSFLKRQEGFEVFDFGPYIPYI